jgi:tetratricopeptide (TPR) repeat protein
MRRKILLKIFITVTSIITLVSVSNAFWDRDVKNAKEFMQAGMYPQAIDILDKRINDKPTDAEAHVLLGICYIKTGKIKNADERFASAVRLNSGYDYKSISQYINPELTDDDIKLIVSPVDANLKFINGEHTKELLNEFIYYEDGKYATDADLKYWKNIYKNIKIGHATLKIVYMTLIKENKIRIVAITSSNGEEKIEADFLYKVNDKWYCRIVDHQ